MSDDRRAVLEERLRQAQDRMTSMPRGTVAWQDARAAVRQLERLILTAEDLPPIPIERRRHAQAIGLRCRTDRRATRRGSTL